MKSELNGGASVAHSHQPRVSMIRVIEAIIIAGVTSIILSVASFFITVPAIKADIENFKNSQTLFNTRVNDELREVNNKLWNLKTDNNK